MSDLVYTDLIIEFGKGANAYTVSMESPLSGEVFTTFTLPFAPLELENFLLKLGITTARGVRSPSAPELNTAKEFGKKLYEALFQGDARAALKSALDDASQHPDHGVRLQFRFRETPELAALPWEFLYRPTNDTFFALSSDTPIVRYVELPEPVRAYPVKLPLRALAMISAPTDYPELDVEHEKKKLMDALTQSKYGDLVARGVVRVDWLEDATLAALTEKLSDDGYHFLHFIGHGGTRDGEGVLILENEVKRGRAVSGSELGQILRDERSLQIVVLNACEGARMPGPSEFASTALALIRQGMPAVIAMQFVITDEAAKVFAGELFNSVLEGNTLDVALTDARRAIFSNNFSTEWATPVLYTRAPGKRIFEIDTSAVAPARATAPPFFARMQDSFKTNPRWFYAGALGAGALIIILLAALLLRNQQPTTPVVVGQITPIVVTATALPTETPEPTLAPLAAVPQGRIIFMGKIGDERGLWSFDLASSQAQKIPIDMSRFDPGGFVNAFDVSQDGRRVAFSAVVPGSKFRIGVIHLDGTNLRRIAQDDGPYTDEIPRWSPDDTQIAFSSSEHSQDPGNQEVYIMDADGTRRARLTESSADSRYPDWSPDGSQLVYAEGLSNNHDLRRITIRTRRIEPLVAEPNWNEIEPTWSPRGDKIAYAALNNVNTTFQVRVLDLGTGAIAVLPCPTNFCLAPTWSPDGSLVAYIAYPTARLGDGEAYYTDPSGKFTAKRFATGLVFHDRPAWASGSTIRLAAATPTRIQSPTASATETFSPTPTAPARPTRLQSPTVP